MPGINVVDNGNINLNAQDPRWQKGPSNDADPQGKSAVERAVFYKETKSPAMEIDALSQPTLRAFTPEDIEDTWYRYDSNVNVKRGLR